MAVVTSSPVDDIDVGLLDAHLYGIGVAGWTSSRLVILVEPEPVVANRGPFLWWLAENAYHTLPRPALIDGGSDGW